MAFAPAAGAGRSLAAACAFTTFGLVAGGEPAAAHAQGPTAYRDAVLAERGLVSYWRAGELAGASGALDSRGANRGAYRSRPRLGVAGLLATSADTAARYDGENDRVSVPDTASLDLRSAFTLEAWVKPRSLRRGATIVRKDRAYLLKAEGAGVRLTFWDQGGRMRNLVAPDQLVVGLRRHLVATHGAGSMRLYVDGKLVKSAPAAAGATAVANGSPLTIGGHGSEPFHGVIDEVAVYRAPLTAAQVAAHHGRGRGSTAVPQPAPAPAGSPLWDGDFDHDGFGPYDLVQEAAEDRVTLVTAPVLRGGFAAKLTTYDGDTLGGSNPRAQLNSAPQHFPGQERYVGWSTFFPADFPTIAGADAFFVFFQFHGAPYSGSPPLGWGFAPDGRIELRRNQQYGYDRVWSMPMVKGRWVSFVAHVNWSKDQRAGFVELWVDGVRQTFPANGRQRLYSQTVMSDQDEGVKTIPTNYRRKGIIPGPVTLYHDEVKVGSSYGDVAP